MINKGNSRKQDPEKAQTIKNFSVTSSKKSYHFERKPKTINTSSTHKLLKTQRNQKQIDSQYIPIKQQSSYKSTQQSAQKKYQALISTKREPPSEGIKETQNAQQNKSIKTNHDSGQYYKYWKAKANEYQESNFNLNRVNSALQEQNEILKHRYTKLQKKYQKLKTNQLTFQQTNIDFPRIQEVYRHQLEQNKNIIDEQAKIIAKQEKKIKELSQYISQNSRLKNILENLEEKMNEVSSSKRQNSKSNSKFSGDQSFSFKQKTKNLLDVQRRSDLHFRDARSQNRSFNFKTNY